MTTFGKTHVAQRVARGVAGGHHQRSGTGVGGQYLRLRPLAGQGQRDGAAAGTEVGQLQRAVRWQAVQRQLHQQFGLRARNQGGRVDLQVQGPETTTTSQVSHRLAREATTQQGLESGPLGGRQRIGGMREQPAARPLQHMQQ
ncbi:hypothetical protein D3C72_1933780 [compost metagenome]